MNNLYYLFVAIFWWIKFTVHLIIKGPILFPMFLIGGAITLLIDFGYEIKNGWRKEGEFEKLHDLLHKIQMYGW